MPKPYDVWFGPENGPATDGYVITPDDTTDFAQPFRSLYVGTGGTVQLVTATGVVLPHVNVASGQTILCAGKRINATGTTASNMIGYL